jgi:uncharacterized protein (TIGR02246 family)
MTADMGAADRAGLEAIVKRMETGWNAGDGESFSADFAEDADFVNVRAEHHRGRAAIAAGHIGILRSIYAGSTNHYTVEGMRLLRPDVAVVHVRASLDVPQGPLAGRNNARFSMVLTREQGGWKIASFHNTMEPPAR